VKKEAGDPTESRRLEAIEKEVEELRRLVAGLHDHLGHLLEKFHGDHEVPVTLPAELSLAPAEPPPPLWKRVAARLRRETARSLRRLVALVHPCNESIRALVFQQASEEAVLPDPGTLQCTPADPEPALLEDIRWLLAYEGVDAVRSRELLLRRHEGIPTMAAGCDPALTDADIPAGKTLIVRDLEEPPEESTGEKMLHPAGLGAASLLHCGCAYRVAMPPSTRRSVLRLGRDTVHVRTRAFQWAILLGDELVCGLEHRVFSAVRALGPAPIISLARTSALGRRRLRDLEKLGCETHDFGWLLHAAVRPAAVTSLLASSGPRSLWAIGGRKLGPVLSRLEAECSGIRIFRESPALEPPFPGSSKKISLLSGDGGDVVLPTPLKSLEVPFPEAGKFRKESGLGPETRILVFIDDLVPAARPEDAILLADELRRMGESRQILWCGEGPLAGRIRELGGLFGLDNFHLRERDPEIWLDADLCCVAGASPYLPVGAAAAMMAGLPVLSVRGNELERFEDSAPIRFAGRPGEIGELARAVRDFPLPVESQESWKKPEEDFPEVLGKLIFDE